MATGVEDDDGGTVGGIEAEGGVSNGVGAMARCRGRRHQWRGVEGGGGVDGVVSREAAT
jgi:hypothetical protein